MIAHPKVTSPENLRDRFKRAGPGKFSAQIGKETFVASITLSLADGRIVSATLSNPVEVLRGECSDPALTRCGEPARFQILRQIENCFSLVSERARECLASGNPVFVVAPDRRLG